MVIHYEVHHYLPHITIIISTPSHYYLIPVSPPSNLAATIYEAGSEIVATSYHPLSCSNFTTKLLIPALHQWYKDEYFQGT